MITQEDICKKPLIFTLRIVILKGQSPISIEQLLLKCLIGLINRLSKVTHTDLRNQVSSIREPQMQNSLIML